MSTKEDEKLLKEMQKMQILEKRNIERQEQDIDMMWHHLLVDEVKQKVNILYLIILFYLLVSQTRLQST